MYTKIFDEIVGIMHQDYAGCYDKEGWDHPEKYRAPFNGMNDLKFVELVQDYLLDFKDLHTSFRQTNQIKKDIGFQVRRYEDRLYVTSSKKEKRVNRGDAVIKLDGVSIDQAASKYKRLLMTETKERQRWEPLMTRFHQAEMMGVNGETYTLELERYEPVSYKPEYLINELNDHTLYMKLTDFIDHDAIANLIRENQKRLESFDNLIIDVRVNKGGSDFAYFTLLPYLFEEKDIKNMNSSEERMLTNCTDRNVDLRIGMMDSFLKGLVDHETKAKINKLKDELERNRGKGFVELDLTEIESETAIEAKKGPNRIVVLSDVYCGSSGDSFVEICKQSSKVTVIGRPTMGLTDYSNLATMQWEGRFQLMYPTSKLSRVDEGKGIGGKGVIPDIYVPWYPRHLEEDVDLKKALLFMGKLS